RRGPAEGAGLRGGGQRAQALDPRGLRLGDARGGGGAAEGAGAADQPVRARGRRRDGPTREWRRWQGELSEGRPGPLVPWQGPFVPMPLYVGRAWRPPGAGEEVDTDYIGKRG